MRHLLAETLPSAVEPAADPIFLWAKRINLAAILLAIAIVVYALVFLRRRADELRAKQFLFFGFCALPIPAMLLTGAIGLDQSKAVRFCAECHEMAPFIEDMRNPRSKTLAAMHYKNRYIQRDHCWPCHTDYGVFGDVKAKSRGFRHLYKHTTRTYSLPIRKPAPYQFSICLNCHAGSQLFNESHKRFSEKEMNREGGCTRGVCHEFAHPAPTKRDGT